MLGLCCASRLLSAPQKAQRPADPNQLATILDRCGNYCERLENSVLNFICVETIREEIFKPKVSEVYYSPYNFNSFREIVDKRTAKNDFVYDYQLIRKAGKDEELRTLLLENGEKKREPNAKLKTSGFSFENIVFGPIVLLSRGWQPKHDYEILGEEEFLGKRAVVIKATPKPGEWHGYLFGKIWVGRDDFSILRIEWAQESIENFGSLREVASNLKLEPDIVLAGEYGCEKNGIRFPSRFTIREAYIYAHPRGQAREFSYYKLNVVMSAYKFFTVETEVKY